MRGWVLQGGQPHPDDRNEAHDDRRKVVCCRTADQHRIEHKIANAQLDPPVWRGSLRDAGAAAHPHRRHPHPLHTPRASRHRLRLAAPRSPIGRGSDSPAPPAAISRAGPCCSYPSCRQQRHHCHRCHRVGCLRGPPSGSIRWRRSPAVAPPAPTLIHQSRDGLIPLLTHLHQRTQRAAR